MKLLCSLWIMCLAFSCNAAAAERLSSGASEPAKADVKAPSKAAPLPNDKNTAIEQQKELIRLQAEIERLQKMYHQHPRRKFISAITQDPVYRPYMFKVIKKIEDFGNKNYPDDRSYSKLKGKLTATIVIKRDGSLEDVVINISSGSDLLDAYAKKVATMAAPYDPLPITEQDIDFLHITRTWGFGNPAGESANH